MDGEMVAPGTSLGNREQFVAGPGTFYKDLHVHACIVGTRRERLPEVVGDLPMLIVEPIHGKIVDVVPRVGDRVTAQVSKIDSRQARVRVIAVGLHQARSDFTGIVRKEDVRVAEVDKVEIFHCFRPGDVIEAEVISLGDSRSYYLSTAKKDLGVLVAKSEAGSVMVPNSWDTMICTITNTKERRKVALHTAVT